MKGMEAPPEPRLCVKCTGAWGAHYLTCPVLRLPPGPVFAGIEEEEEL